MPENLSPILETHSVHELDAVRLQRLMPDIRDLADNIDLLDHERERRFDRDDPPSYTSSTGPVIEDVAHWPQNPLDPQDADLARKLGEPLDDGELRWILSNFEAWQEKYHRGHRYADEYHLETGRLERNWLDRGRPGWNLSKRAGRQRLDIMARHCIKK